MTQTPIKNNPVYRIVWIRETNVFGREDSLVGYDIEPVNAEALMQKYGKFWFPMI